MSKYIVIGRFASESMAKSALQKLINILPNSKAYIFPITKPGKFKWGIKGNSTDRETFDYFL